MRAGEHIVLETEVREIPRLQSPRRMHGSVQCRSRLRRQSLTLSIIDYYYLAVRVGRGGAATTDYVLDLRFVDPSFVLTRIVPWRCIWAALALTVAAAATSALWYATETSPRARHFAGMAFEALVVGMTLAYLVVAARLVETVVLYSLHGRAAVLEYRGGLGTLRRARPFLRRLSAHVQLAVTARRVTRAEHLRDELREHHRLKQDGVLAAATYDASKARILAQHGVPIARDGKLTRRYLNSHA